jgi:hypothetical protein
MPGGNGTGPLGQGPMTGRGLGYCAGYGAPGFTTNGRLGLGLGFRGGFGLRYPYRYSWFGRGWGYRGYYSTYGAPAANPYYSYPYKYGKGVTTDEVEALKDTLSQVSNVLGEISRRIAELEKNKSESST